MVNKSTHTYMHTQACVLINTHAVLAMLSVFHNEELLEVSGADGAGLDVMSNRYGLLCDTRQVRGSRPAQHDRLMR